MTDVYGSVHNISYEQNVALVDFTACSVLTELWLTGYFENADGDGAIISCANGDKFVISRYGYGITQRCLTNQLFCGKSTAGSAS